MSLRFCNKPFYSKCKIVTLILFLIWQVVCISKNTSGVFLFGFYFYFVVDVYFKTHSKDLDHVALAPKVNRLWKSQYNFKTLQLVNDI